MKIKKQFDFILVLKNTDINTSNLEDSIFKAGCDDALIHYRNGAVYLNFTREAITLEDAVISAINDIQSSDKNLEVASVGPENLVTESEIAKRLNVSRQTVSLWIKGERRQAFPHPVMRLTEKSPLWSWYDIVIWLRNSKILTDNEIIINARFLANINAALEEKNRQIRNIRNELIKKISSA